jgi:RNA polymerase sigma-70 factor, ECF subfamily
MAWFATGNRDDALEIVQESMMGLVQRYAGHAPADWPALFYTVLQSRIRDWHRREKVRGRLRHWFGPAQTTDDPESDADPLAGFAAPTDAEPDARMAAAEARAALDRAIRALPQRQQQAFLLRVWAGLDTAGTAAAMDLTEGSVKTHYSRALAALRDRLREYEFHDA